MKKFIDFFEDNFIIFFVYAVFGWIYEVLWIFYLDGKWVNRGALFGPYLPVYGFGMLLLVNLLRKFIKKKHYLGSLYGFISVLFFVNFIYIIIIEYSVPRIYNVMEFISKYGLLELFVSIIAIVIYYLFLNMKKKRKKINVTPLMVFILIFIIATLVEYISHFALDKLAGIMLWDYSKDFLNINKRICFDASRNFAILGTFAIYVIQPLVDKFTKKLSINKKHILVGILLFVILLDWMVL